MDIRKGFGKWVTICQVGLLADASVVGARLVRVLQRRVFQATSVCTLECMFQEHELESRNWLKNADRNDTPKRIVVIK